MFSQAPWWDGSAIAILSEQNALGFGKLSRDGWTSQIAGFLFLALHPLTILCLIVPEHRGVGILLTGLLGLSYGVFAGDWMFCGIACCYAVAFVPVSPPKKI